MPPTCAVKWGTLRCRVRLTGWPQRRAPQLCKPRHGERHCTPSRSAVTRSAHAIHQRADLLERLRAFPLDLPGPDGRHRLLTRGERRGLRGGAGAADKQEGTRVSVALPTQAHQPLAGIRTSQGLTTRLSVEMCLDAVWIRSTHALPARRPPAQWSAPYSPDTEATTPSQSLRVGGSGC